MKQSKRNVPARLTKRSERGVFVLLDADSDDTQIEAAVRVLLGLPDNHEFESDGEKAGPEDELRDDLHD